MRRSILWATTAAVCVVVGVLITRGFPGPPQEKPVECTDRLDKVTHADTLATRLLRREADGTLRVTGAASMLPLKRARKLMPEDFRVPQAVGILRMSADQGRVPSGTYCVKAQLTGSDPADKARWVVSYHRETAPGVYEQTATQTTPGITHYMPEALAEKDEPRVSARIWWYDPTPNTSAGPQSRGVGAALQEAEDGEYLAWYRCGTGCCGSSLNF